MNLAFIATLFAILLTLGYRLYGGWVARRLELDDSRRTPAHERSDRMDYVPTRRFYLFGQHFSAIAAAGPIAGPILACQTFGWLPCMLWIALGVVLIGAVHDFSTLFASVRHGARSIAQIAGDHLGVRAGRSLMLFIWIALVYVTVAFADITAASFTAGPVELEGVPTSFHPGGAVAVSSVLYLLLAVVMGLVQRAFRPPLWLVTAIFVPATFGVSWLGTSCSHWLLLDRTTWGILILVYCAVASLTPVWALLQPRGYLGGFVLYTALALGCLGVFVGGYEIRQPAFRTWDAGGMTGALFPFLFVTIACGACSGFHGLVCSGTTSKQIDRESDTRPVGYGAMLAEGFVALIALVTVMIMTQDEIRGLSPGTIYGNGIGRFLTLLIGEEHLPFAMTFGAMAFSTFVFDTLDVSTRLGRYIVQELTGWTGPMAATGAAVLTISLPTFFLSLADEGSWVKFWTLFGASNQLLAALTLTAVSVWLVRTRKSAGFTLVPMFFVLATTLWALARLAVANLRASRGLDVALVNAVAATLLIALALYLLVSAARVMARERRAAGGGSARTERLGMPPERSA